MSWAVVETETQGVHVLPWNDDADEPAREHRAAYDCYCHPSPHRDGPLDEPVISHHEPSWPGAADLVA